MVSRDVWVRAGKTFLQAFLAVLVASGFSSVTDLFSVALLDQAAVAGLAALFSMVQNVLLALRD